MRGIYAIVNSANGKMYIGSTTSYKTRKKRHFAALKAGIYSKGHPQLQDDYNKYGKQSFRFIELEIINTDSVDVLLQKETDYIIRFGTFFEDKGYNIAIPNERIYRKAFIEKYGEDFLRELVCSNDDLLLREEWKHIPNYRKEKVYQIDNENNIVKVWDCRGDICEFYKVSKTSNILFNSHRGSGIKRKKWKGFIWVTHTKYDKNINYSDYFIKSKPKAKVKKEKIKKPIIPYEDRNIFRKPISLQNIETQEVKEFKSILEASRFLGVAKSKLYTLKRGFRNKGAGKIAKVNQIRGWKLK